jgi:hypothetical protein
VQQHLWQADALTLDFLGWREHFGAAADHDFVVLVDALAIEGAKIA